MRRQMIRLLPVFVLVACGGVGVAMAAGAATTAGAATVKTAGTKYGTVLVAANGRTLYRYTPDHKGVSTCTGVCLTYWPKLLVKSGVKPTAAGGAAASMLGTIKAAHGMAQVTYGGYPLYFFAGDKKAGNCNGEGTEKTWYVVNTKGALVKNPVKTTSKSTTTSSSSGGGGWGWPPQPSTRRWPPASRRPPPPLDGPSERNRHRIRAGS